jgi:acyl carrier protein
MTTDTVTTKLIEILSEQTGRVVDLVSNPSLENDLGLDSLEVVRVAIDCEEAFNIEIGDDPIQSWQSVGDVVNTIVAALASRDDE